MLTPEEELVELAKELGHVVKVKLEAKIEMEQATGRYEEACKAVQEVTHRFDAAKRRMMGLPPKPDKPECVCLNAGKYGHGPRCKLRKEKTK